MICADVDARNVDGLAQPGDDRGGARELGVDRVEALERVREPLLKQDVEAARGADDHQADQDHERPPVAPDLDRGARLHGLLPQSRRAW